MACEVQNQYQLFEQSNPSFLAHHELVIKKLSALSVYMDAQGKGSSMRSQTVRMSQSSDAARDWYAEANSAAEHSLPCQLDAGHNAVRTSTCPIACPSAPPAFQFCAQASAPPLSTSAPSCNPLTFSPPATNSTIPRVASFSNGWHDAPKQDKGRESLAASAARFYEQKRRASMAAHKAQTLRSSPDHLSPLGRSPISPFLPREGSQDSLDNSSFYRKSSPGATSNDGGFFFTPVDKRAHSGESPGSPTLSLSSAGISGDSHPVSPIGTDSDGSGQSATMEGVNRFLPRHWDMEAESVLARGKQKSSGEDQLAPLIGRGLRRGLSEHYGGKSRSFTCLADVVTSPIQDLAKPANPYAKRRKNNNGSHSNLLGRASSGVYGNFPRNSLLADNLGFEGSGGTTVSKDSEMSDCILDEGGDVATALQPIGRLQPLRSQSMADLRAMSRRRACPEY